MSNTINPYNASRPELHRQVQPSEFDEDANRHDPKRADTANQKLAKGDPNHSGPDNRVVEQPDGEMKSAQAPAAPNQPQFVPALDGAIDRENAPSAAGALQTQPTQKLEGLSPAEQQLIYRYFPASPSLELRLYNPDLSTNKVDPGAVGSRVDIRG